MRELKSSGGGTAVAAGTGWHSGGGTAVALPADAEPIGGDPGGADDIGLDPAGSRIQGEQKALAGTAELVQQ